MRWTDLPAEAGGTLTAQQWLLERAAGLLATSFGLLAARLHAFAPQGSLPLVAIEPGALESAWQHLAASRLERGGLLLGRALHAQADAQSPVALVHVRAAVPGLQQDGTEYSLRLHAGVWDAARAALQPGEVVVGWFHSHPDLGAFFSGTDRRTQAGFFHHPFSLGWVVDPVRGEQAWFCGPDALEMQAGDVVLLDRAAGSTGLR
jgi:proteasome lid subunit RPN8/RPN11